jgi:sulfite reductase (NADPH) flavoprotein alpha-component
MIIDRHHPFPLVIKDRYPLTKKGSTKETYHVVLDLKGTHLPFKVGDSLGIYAHNDPLLVDRLLQILHAQADTQLRDILLHKANLSRLTPMLRQGIDVPPHFDLLDFFTAFPQAILPSEKLIPALVPLLPRFYSIASSPKTHPDELHLTVSLSSYLHNGESRYGVASYFLCHLAHIGTTPIPSYVQATPHFTLPHDEAPIIMIGPGTGVAPFRGFLHERQARNAKGKNWLFFGERNRSFDYFYEEFWSPLVAEDFLRLDLAFSRDQAHKIYVQHKLLEQGEELWKWMEEGAHLFICGEADPMAREVETTFIRIFEEHGKTPDPRSFLRSLRQQKRYLTDVY